MQFVRFGEFLAVSRITGPRHNLLQIRLSESSVTEVVCDRLPPEGRCRHEPLNEALIIQAVCDAVSTANSELETSFAVSHIKYIENDTNPEIIYGILAIAILRHLHSGGEFIEIHRKEIET